MRQSIKIFLIILVSLSCKQSPESKKCLAAGVINKASTNYYENDSIQKKMEYYPPSIYFEIRIINATKEDICIPIIDKFNDTTESYIIAKYKNQEFKLFQIPESTGYVVSSRDTLKLLLVLNVLNYHEAIEKHNTKLIDYIHNIAFKATLSFSANDLFTCTDKVSVPDIIEFKRSENFKLEYRNESDKEYHMWY